jgi:hypothetical protein
VFSAFNYVRISVLRKKRYLIIIIPIFLIGTIVLFKMNTTSVAEYLSDSHRVDANILIIESWLPDAALKTAFDEFQNKSYDLIITSGIRSSELDFCMVAMNGYLIFYPEFARDTAESKTDHVFEVLARSKMGGIYCSHFNFYINDSLIADFNACEKPAKYSVKWNCSLKDIDSVMVQFTNDMVDDKGDRNLYVKEIIVDNKIIIPYQYHSVFDTGRIGGNNRLINDYESHSQLLRNKLISLGIDSSKVVAVTGKRTVFNRTFASANAVKRWLKNSGMQVNGVNIVSMGAHSRRTWLTYRRILKKSYNVGIISLTDTYKFRSEFQRDAKILGEVLDLIYYWIFLIPYNFV